MRLGFGAVPASSPICESVWLDQMIFQCERELIQEERMPKRASTSEMQDSVSKRMFPGVHQLFTHAQSKSLGGGKRGLL